MATATSNCQVTVEGLDSEYLDCINDNLAALLRHAGVEDVRTPFACQWHLDFDEHDPLPLPRLERTEVAQMILEQTGFEFVPAASRPDDPVALCAEAAARGQPVLALGDAYLLPWVPYFGRQHMTHSFVVDGVSGDRRLLSIADAYQNKTQWGEARPLHTCIPAVALPAILEASEGWRGGHLFVLERKQDPDEINQLALLRENAEQILRQLGERRLLRRLSEAYAAHAEDLDAVRRFTLACWLIARSRALHGLWLRQLSSQDPLIAETRIATAFDELVSSPWRRVTEFSYLLERRVSAGRSAPRSAFELIEGQIEPGELELAERLLRAVV